MKLINYLLLHQFREYGKPHSGRTYIEGRRALHILCWNLDNSVIMDNKQERPHSSCIFCDICRRGIYILVWGCLLLYYDGQSRASTL